MDSKLWTVCFVTVSVCCFLVIGLSDEQRSAAWLQSISLMNQHKSPSKSFPTMSSFTISVLLSHLTPPSLPHGATWGQAQREWGRQAHSTWLWVWGQQKSGSLQGPSALTRLYHHTHIHTHIYTPHSAHTSGVWGKHTVSPLGELRRQGLRFLRAILPFFSTSSSSPFPAGYALHMLYDRQPHAALPIHLSVRVCLA